MNIETALADDAIAKRIGAVLADALDVNHKGLSNLWATGWGTKTSAGLARTVYSQIKLIAELYPEDTDHA